MKKVILIIILIMTILLVIGFLLNELSKSRNFQFFGNLITNVRTDEKIIALTFDDGPGPNTEKI